MILNMHVRKDYRLLVESPVQDRELTMCNKKSTGKYVGIPYINGHPAMIIDGYPAWCLRCCAAVVQEISEILNNHTVHEDVRGIYIKMILTCGAQVAKATSKT